MANYDIVVVGGGVIGLTFAACASRLPLNIAVIEQRESPNNYSKHNFPMRVSAITPATEFALRRLGIWNTIQLQRACTFEKTFVWDPVGMGEISFSAAGLGFPHLGHIIENDLIIESLHHFCQSQENIDLYFGMTVEAFYPQVDGGELSVSGKTFSAPLFVAADGAHSWLRQQAGIEQTVKPYQHTAIVATVAPTESHQHTSWQCFLPTGPLAFLPLSNMPEHENLCSIVWSCVPELADELMALDRASFAERLTIAFDYRLGEIDVLTDRIAYPLVMRHAKQYHANHVVLMGDAAHTIHPLAGQGMNLGMMDACQFVEDLEFGIKQQRPINSQRILRRYERARKMENQMMAATMQGFKQLFSTDAGLIPTIRSLGLQVTNQCKPLKHLLLRHAMGLLGEKPALAMFDPLLLMDKT